MPASGRMPCVPAAQELVHRHVRASVLAGRAGAISSGRLGETVAEGRPLERAADPLGVERVGPEEDRRELLLDQGDRACLGLAAPDGGDAGLAQADAAGLVADAHQNILANEVLAQRADDGEFGRTVPMGSARTAVMDMGLLCLDLGRGESRR